MINNASVMHNNAADGTPLLLKVIDIKRFGEIVGEDKLKDLSQFDGTRPCTSEFMLLHSIFNELTDAAEESAVDMSDINCRSVELNVSSIVPNATPIENVFLPKAVHVSY